MSKTWRCGDCDTEYPKSVDFCRRPFDDYLSLRGGSVESAIRQAVDKAIAPLISAAERRLNRRQPLVVRWKWTSPNTITKETTHG